MIKIDRLHVVLAFGMMASMATCAYLAVARTSNGPGQYPVPPEAAPFTEGSGVSPSTEATARTILHHMYQCEVRSAQMQMAVVASDVDQVKALLSREDQYRDLIQTNRAHMKSAVRSLSERELLNLNAASRQAMLLFSQDGLADSPLPQRGSQ